MVKVAIIVGSESDKEMGKKAVEILKAFDIEYEFHIFSAHRSPKALQKYIDKSEASIFIAIAGLSAALPGFISANTIKPVIGVPKEVKLGGLDSLLSIVQMPTGVPVACVGIDNARNAAILSLEILALNDEDLVNKLIEYRCKMRAKISSPHT